MILRNAIRCKLCGDVIESTYRHDFKWCKCGNCAVDGGKSYLKRCFKTRPDDLEELSVSVDVYKYSGNDLYEENNLPDFVMDALYTDRTIYYDGNFDLWANDKLVSVGDYITLGNDGKIKAFTYDELNLEIERLLKELPPYQLKGY